MSGSTEHAQIVDANPSGAFFVIAFIVLIAISVERQEARKAALPPISMDAQEPLENGLLPMEPGEADAPSGLRP